MKVLTIIFLLVALLAENQLQAMRNKLNNIKNKISQLVDNPANDPLHLTINCIYAIKASDIKTVKKILKNKNFNISEELPHDPPCDIHYSKPPLHLAAELGNVDLVKLLIKFGADVNLLSYQSRDPRFCPKIGLSFSRFSPLAFAILSDTSNPEVIQELINAGADINACFDLNVTPLHLAAKTLNIPALKILLAQPTINQWVKTESTQQTALDWAQETDGTAVTFLMYSKKKPLPEQELHDKREAAIRLLTMKNTLTGTILLYIRQNLNLFKPEAINNLPSDLREEILS